MRKWHRWLAVVAGIFIIWIAATGLVGQIVSLAGGERHGPPPKSAIARADGPADPALPRADGPGDHKDVPGGPPRDFYHFIIDLHSGNYFGPVGKVVSALMGAALLFFSGSGVWMYVDMFRRRRKAGKRGLFWG